MLRRCGPGDLDLHVRLLSDPETMAHLGGPEPVPLIERRHERYQRMSDADEGLMLVIETDDGTAAGTIGYWVRSWRDAAVWETGWLVLPEHRGRGLASGALRQLVEQLESRPARRPLHAFPAPDNAPSNAICARAGFELLGEVDFEYPAGQMMRSNDWRLDLDSRLSANPS